MTGWRRAVVAALLANPAAPFLVARGAPPGRQPVPVTRFTGEPRSYLT